MSIRGELSIIRESATRKHEGVGSSLFFVALTLVLILLAVASVTFAPAASDAIPVDAEWLIGP